MVDVLIFSAIAAALLFGCAAGAVIMAKWFMGDDHD